VTIKAPQMSTCLRLRGWLGEEIIPGNVPKTRIWRWPEPIAIDAISEWI
jgi:hypothetical protein